MAAAAGNPRRSCARSRGGSSAGAAGSTASATRRALARRRQARVSTGERRDVVEAIVLGRRPGRPALLADFRASGPLPLSRRRRAEGRRDRRRRCGDRSAPRLSAATSPRSRRSAAVAAYALAVGLHPSVVRAAIAAALGSLAWLAGRERDRWQALLVGAAVLLAWNPYALLDAGFQLSFAAVASIFVVTPRVVRALEGYPVSREARAAHRRLDCVRSRDRAGHVVPVPPDLARHGPGERRGGSGRRGGARPRARDRGRRAGRAAGRGRAGALNGWGAWFVAGVRARVRRACPARRSPRPRGCRARSGRGRGRRLCLAAWRASAS